MIRLGDVDPNKISDIMKHLYLTPEVRNLSSIVENNKYHSNQSSLNHTVEVVSNLEKALEFEHVEQGVIKNRLNKYFSEAVGRHKRKDLLRFAAVLHDIGKGMVHVDDKGEIVPVLQYKENGDTTAKKHAKVGAEKADDILLHTDLWNEDRHYVCKVIKSHMELFNVLENLPGSSNPEKIYEKARAKLGKLYLDVLLHTKADYLGSKKREDFEEKEFKIYGKTYANQAEFIDDMIVQSMDIREIKGNAEELLKIVESGTAYGTIYVHPLQEKEVGKYFKKACEDRILDKIDKGIIPEERKEGALKGVQKKADKLINKIRFTELSDNYSKIVAERPVRYYLQ